jgi:hypothetical protein
VRLLCLRSIEHDLLSMHGRVEMCYIFQLTILSVQQLLQIFSQHSKTTIRPFQNATLTMNIDKKKHKISIRITTQWSPSYLFLFFPTFFFQPFLFLLFKFSFHPDINGSFICSNNDFVFLFCPIVCLICPSNAHTLVVISLKSQPKSFWRRNFLRRCHDHLRQFDVAE